MCAVTRAMRRFSVMISAINTFDMRAVINRFKRQCVERVEELLTRVRHKMHIIIYNHYTIDTLPGAFMHIRAV